MYNFNHLFYFYTVAKVGGVSAAAKHLRISQPSLSSQMKVLERSLDARLFQRVGRNNELTEAGLLVFGFCRQMFELSEQMGELISKKLPSASRRMHIGVSDEVDRPFVVEVVSHFLMKHGFELRPKVTVVSGTHEQLAERLRFRELDAVVTPLAMIDPELENLARAEVPVALAYSRRIRLAPRQKKARIVDAVAALAGEQGAHWLMPSSRFKLRAETDQFFERSQLKGRIVFESDVISSLVRSVIDGVGMTFLPMLYIAREVREGAVRVIAPKDGFWKYRVWLTCHGQNRNDELIQALSSSFKAICDQALD